MAPTAVSSPNLAVSSTLENKSSLKADIDLVSPLNSLTESPIPSLRSALISEQTPLAVRFRALFSLKHYASQQPPTSETMPAIQSIAAALSSPSALLKHELAYCLGQTRNLAAVPFLRVVLRDREEHAMCRHEAAEALGALGDWDSLDTLKVFRDDTGEVAIVRETCDIAVERIEWEHSTRRKAESIRDRYASSQYRHAWQLIFSD